MTEKRLFSIHIPEGGFRIMEKYWEWLCSIPGLYYMQLEVLLQCFATPEEIYLAPEEETDRIRGKGCKWIGRLQEWQRRVDPEQLVSEHRSRGICFASMENEQYPGKLLKIKDRPYGLFFSGKLPDENEKTFAIVGARMCTRAGKERAEQLAAGIAGMGGAVISGGAYGIDGAAQWAALEAGGTSYGVLGCGVDRCYPPSHVQLFERLRYQGGILSEYPPGTEPKPYNFPLRNRIISGLADCVIVVEARKQSGSLITAEYAADQGKQVLAFPGRVEDELSEGCNELISQGSGIILSVDSFLKTNFSEYKDNKQILSETLSLAPTEKLVYSSLGLHSRTLWELEECTVLSLAELGDCLMQLELKGLIKETEHGCYARTGK